MNTTKQTPAWSRQDLEKNPHHVDDKADRVQDMFANIAPKYDLNNRLHSMWQDQRWRKKAVKLAALKATDDVLDVACGTGDLTFAFAKANPASVTGLDYTPAMLEIARIKARQAGRPEIEFIEGDATALSLEDDSFDVVSIAFGLRNTTAPEKAIAEFHRVLRPGGRLVILEFSQPRNPVMRFGNYIYCMHIMPVTATLIARDHSGAYRYLPRSVESFQSPEEIAQLMQKHGFADISQTPLTFGVCTVSVGTLPS